MKDRKFFVWLVLGAVAVILWLPGGPGRLIKPAVREVFAPFQGLTTTVSGSLRSTVDRVRSARVFSQSADELAQEVFVLRDRIKRVEVLEAENAELRRVVGFVETSPRTLVPCEVISRRDVGGWWNGVRLNKGSRDGLSENMAVVTYAGLVGRTIEVTPHTSDVLLLTDRNCRVAARIVRLDSDGIVRGDGASLRGGSPSDMIASFNPCRMDFVEKAAELRVGDRVVSSGLGGIFPADVPIGRIVRYAMDASGLYQTAMIAPTVDAKRLRHVFVVVE